MQNNIKIAIFVMILLFANPLIVNASETTVNINDLIEKASIYDKTQISIEGEVIGEFLERGDYGWLNILDSTNAIGVWISAKDVSIINVYGDYDHKGDIVRIKGIFYQTCPYHDGETDFHCTSIEITKNGYEVQHQISFSKIVILVFLLLGVVILAIILLKIKKKPSI